MRRLPSHFIVGLWAFLALASPGAAQEPAKPAAAKPAGDEPTGAAPAAPNVGAVKDTVKDAVKDIVKGAIPSLPAAAPAPAAVAAQDPAAALAARIAMLRRKTLKDEDFLDNDQTNRDPFRSYVRMFTAKEGPRAPKVPAIFEKFAIEELTLIAIVSGDANPRAMFRDPGGTGLSVKRGDYLSKAAARISKILSDRVILELNEMTGTGETRAIEKPILVNPEGAQK